MKIAAIICEYNPFHKGHELQINFIRNNTDADRIIAIMSGDFVQRGEPAIFSKETRARMALSMGVDAVFMLPVAYATSGAELFARGGVQLAAGLGADYLVFGSESGDINELAKAAERLKTEGTADSSVIQRYISEGNTFAKARALAFPEYDKLLSSPNNVLAIEYIIAGHSLNAGLSYITHPRSGASYDETSIVSGLEYQSATALRKLILSPPEGQTDTNASLNAFVPDPVVNIIRDETDKKRYVQPDDLSDILYSRLLFMGNEASFLEVSDDLLNRIKNRLGDFTGYTGFAETIKSKNLTRSGVMRGLCHILLGLTGPAGYYKDTSKLKYARLLGFRADHADLFSHIETKGTLEIVSKVPDAINNMDEFNRMLFEEDHIASALYEYIMSRRSGLPPVSEYSKPIIKIRPD